MDIDKLKALALAAKKGPWTATNWTCHAPTTIKSLDGTVIAETTGFGRHSDECVVDAAFIADACPATVIELIAENERLRADATRYQWLKERFTGYDFYWGGAPPYEDDADKGKCVIVFECGQDFNAGRDFEAGIDAAIGAHTNAGREPVTTSSNNELSK